MRSGSIVHIVVAHPPNILTSMLRIVLNVENNIGKMIMESMRSVVNDRV